MRIRAIFAVLPVTLVFGQSGLSELTATRASDTELVAGAACTPAAPCNFRFGANTVSITAGVRLTLPKTATGTVRAYAAPNEQIGVIDTMGVTCSGACFKDASGKPQFPRNSIPLFSWQASVGVWDKTGSDLRSYLSQQGSIAPGTGIVFADSPDNAVTIMADTTIIGLRVAVPAVATSKCKAGNYAFDKSYFYQCVADDTWRRAALSSW